MVGIICPLLILSSPSACWTSGASKNRDCPYKMEGFYFFTLTLLCYYLVVGMLLVFFDELFDNFFYEFIDEFFDESFDKVFDEF